MAQAEQNTILLADGDSCSREAVMRSLKEAGFAVIPAESGGDAIALARAASGIDLILMAVELGDGMDGVTAAEIILGTHDMPVLFMSSRIGREEREKIVSVPAYGLIDLKSGADTLLASVALALRMSESGKGGRPRSRFRSANERDGVFFERNNAMVFMAMRDGLISYASPSWTTYLGHAVNEVESRSLQAFVHGEDWPAVRDLLSRTAQPGAGQNELEYRIRHRDGAWRWHVATAAPPREASGGGGSFLIVSRDITARKQLEESVHRDRILLRTVLDIVPALICVRSHEGRYLLVNKPLADFLGETVGSVTGRFARDISVNKKTVSDFLVFEREAIEKWETKYIPEVSVRDCSGKTRIFESFIVPLVVNGEAAALVVSRDHTERHRMEKERRELRAKLHHADRVGRGGEIAVSLAHELNQPLTGIMSNAQAAQLMLASEKPDLAEIGNILADIVADDKRAGKVIHRLRSFLKRQAPFWDMIDINETVMEILKLLRGDSALKEVAVTTELTADLPKLFADRVQVQQVILNLVINAEEAMAAQPPDDRTVTVSTLRGDSGEVIVSVRDVGPGIAQEDPKRLFEAFQDTEKPDGMGVGLAICRSIVEAHGGRIWAANNPDRGFTVRFSLPIAKKTGPTVEKFVEDQAAFCMTGQERIVHEPQ